MNNLKQLMKQAGVKQVVLARQLGISQASVSDIANGKMAMTVENAIAIANILGVTVGCVVGTEPIPPDYGERIICTETPAAESEAAAVRQVTPAKQSRRASQPFTAEQMDFLEQWKKDVAREVADVIAKDTSLSGGAAG